MAQTENKVQFNLSNCHYAVINADEPLEYATPVAIPGAVSLTLAHQGDIQKFYADGIVYWQAAANNGYEGELEIARIPDKMFTEVFGQTTVATDNVLLEKSGDKPKNFALLFQIDGDVNNQLYVMYSVAATRPGIDASTNEEQAEPKPQKMSISCVALADGRINARTTAETTEEVRTNWFKQVYVNQGV